MFSKSLELVNFQQGGVFRYYHEMKNEIKLNFDKIILTDQDENELNRHGYELALPGLVGANGNCIEQIQKILENKGIKDPNFRNAIIAILSQSNIGLPFRLADMLPTLFKEVTLVSENAREDFLEVKIHPKNVALKIKGKLSYSDADGEKQDALSYQIQVDITPTTITLKQCTITKLSEDPKINTEFLKLEKEIPSLLSKIINFIKELIGYKEDYQEDYKIEMPRPGQ